MNCITTLGPQAVPPFRPGSRRDSVPPGGTVHGRLPGYCTQLLQNKTIKKSYSIILLSPVIHTPINIQHFYTLTYTPILMLFANCYNQAIPIPVCYGEIREYEDPKFKHQLMLMLTVLKT